MYYFNIYKNKYIDNFIFYEYGDWGWGLGQSPIPNPQSPK